MVEDVINNSSAPPALVATKDVDNQIVASTHLNHIIDLNKYHSNYTTHLKEIEKRQLDMAIERGYLRNYKPHHLYIDAHNSQSNRVDEVPHNDDKDSDNASYLCREESREEVICVDEQHPDDNNDNYKSHRLNIDVGSPAERYDYAQEKTSSHPVDTNEKIPVGSDDEGSSGNLNR